MKLTQGALDYAFYKLCIEWEYGDDENKQVDYKIFSEEMDVDRSCIKIVRREFIKELYIKLYEDYEMPKAKKFVSMFYKKYEPFKRAIKRDLEKYADIW